MNTKIIAQYLQFLRKSSNYTQDDLAAKLDISRQAVSKWETGTAIPDTEILLRLSKLYGITINDILEPVISPQRITDFEQIASIPEHELKEILEQCDNRSIAIALMGASPGMNHLLGRLFPNTDYAALQNAIGQVRIDEVEDMQANLISMINLYFIDSKNTNR